MSTLSVLISLFSDGTDMKSQVKADLVETSANTSFKLCLNSPPSVVFLYQSRAAEHCFGNSMTIPT